MRCLFWVFDFIGWCEEAGYFLFFLIFSDFSLYHFEKFVSIMLLLFLFLSPLLLYVLYFFDMVKLFESGSCNLMKIVLFDEIEIKVIFSVLLLNERYIFLLVIFFKFEGKINRGLRQHESRFWFLEGIILILRW